MKTRHRPLKGLQTGLSLVILFGLAVGTLATFRNAQAATPQVARARLHPDQGIRLPLQGQPGEADLSFQQLGGEDMILRPRYSQESLIFELPYRWQIQAGSAYVDLAYDLITDELATFDPAQVDPGVLEAYVDGEIVGSIIPEVGLGRTAHFDLPASVLAGPQQNEHVITVAYTSRVHCAIDDIDPTRIVVRQDSLLHFDFSLTPITIDLADFPQPLYQTLLEPEFVLLVIPDALEVGDLEAAAAIAATIGSATFGDLQVIVRRASDVTPELLASMSSILIGTPTDNGMIGELYARGALPSVLTSDGRIEISATGQTASPDDGVIQEIISEPGQDHATLIVTGTTAEAVQRSTRALSRLDPRFGLNGSAAIISDVSDFVQPSPQTSATLTELGLGQEVLEEFGVSVSRVDFFVGSNWIFEQNARLNLEYRHSAALNSGASSLNLLLNGEPIASVALVNANTATATALIELPSEDLKPGRNQLMFAASLEMEDPCAEPRSEAAWVRVLGTSKLDLDHRAGSQSVLGALKDPLDPFFSKSDLADVWFVLPEKPTQKELEGALQLAWLMGESTNGSAFAPRLSLGSVPEEARDAYHFMLIGRPTANPFLNEVNPYLYQPFVDGEDTLQQVVGNVTYRLPERFSLGWIQLIRSPWNVNRAVTVVSGTTEEGLGWAIDSLIAQEPYTDLTFLGPDRIESLNGEDMLRGSIAAIESVTGEQLAPSDLQATPATGLLPPPPVSPAEAQTDYAIPSGAPRSVTIISFGLILAGAVIVVGGFLLRRRR